MRSPLLLSVETSVILKYANKDNKKKWTSNEQKSLSLRHLKLEKERNVTIWQS